MPSFVSWSEAMGYRPYFELGSVNDAPKLWVCQLDNRVEIVALFAWLRRALSPPDYRYPHKSDADALRGDWERVGDDIRRAMANLPAKAVVPLSDTIVPRREGAP